MKGCKRCNQGKELDEFANCKSNKDGKQFRCKECQKAIRTKNKEHDKEKKKQWYEKNKEHVKQRANQNYKYNKEYYRKLHKQYRENNKEYLEQYRENNKEYFKQYEKQYREVNKEFVKQIGKQYRQSSMSGNENSKKRKEIGEYEDIQESENSNLMCKCANCDEWFEPTRQQIGHRLDAINGNSRGENRLYCSEKCKEECPVFHQQKYPKGQKPYTDREIQKEVRDLRIEVDNYTCQNCGTHQDELEESLICHHIGPMNESPITSADVDECKMVCKKCHKEIHQQPGCTLNEVKCNQN